MSFRGLLLNGVGVLQVAQFRPLRVHVHNYHCKRLAGLVRVGILYGLGWVLGTWIMEWLLGMVWRGRPPARREL
jgi:hypothetical protein